MSLSNIKHRASQKGFTIVELLIVVVIIGILAAIVVVAYNGLTNRAKSSKAASTLSEITKKMEVYNAEQGTYPATYSALTSPSSAAWYIPPNTFTVNNAGLTSSTPETTFNFHSCTGGGYRLRVFNYANGSGTVDAYYGGSSSSSTCNTAIGS